MKRLSLLLSPSTAPPPYIPIRSSSSNLQALPSTSLQLLCSVYSDHYITDQISVGLYLIPIEMDLEWLLPEQIEQILRLCDLSSIHDPSLAANILEQHQWNFEGALNDLVGQNDHMHEAQQQPAPAPALVKPTVAEEKMEEYNDLLDDEEGFELDPDMYHQLDSPLPTSAPVVQPSKTHHSSILAQQNKEYEEMERSYIAKLAEDEQWNKYIQMKEQEYLQHKEEFAAHVVERPIQIKFRLAGKTHTHAFDLADPVSKVFTYVSGHLRDSLQHKYAEIDLTQAFPAVSLKERVSETLEAVFGDSNGEVLIVKEL